MAALGPFEAGPTIVVAVSGGPDSMALALLAADWARRHGGVVEAVTVDHGLRPESSDEARQVGRWLKAHGVSHRVLVWPGPHPQTGIQAAARAARYELLTGHCRRRGILHLLLAHQRDDQAETVLMRQEAGSGPDGLAGMAALSERNGVRLLRPLLDVPRAHLIAFLIRRGQAFIDDPSNRDTRFLRPRLRRALSPNQRDKAVARARRAGRQRAGVEAAVARLMAETVRLEPHGYGSIELVKMCAAPDALAIRLLGAVLSTIGGRIYRPAPDGLLRLITWLRSNDGGAGRTLAGCRLVKLGDRLIICREGAATAASMDLRGRQPMHWDGRFLALPSGPAVAPLTLRALGATSLSALRRHDLERASTVAAVFAPARAGLPSLEGLDGFLTVPHLDWQGAGSRAGGALGWRVTFRPLRPLAEAPFQPVS